MQTKSELQIWDLWYPQAGATGVPFARGRLGPTNVLWVHAAPPVLTAEVRAVEGQRIAFAQDLHQTADCPMTRLMISGRNVAREDLWPTNDDIGGLVILPGGEVGQLVRWWNAEDGSEWCWQAKFFSLKI